MWQNQFSRIRHYVCKKRSGQWLTSTVTAGITVRPRPCVIIILIYHIAPLYGRVDNGVYVYNNWYHAHTRKLIFRVKSRFCDYYYILQYVYFILNTYLCVCVYVLRVQYTSKYYCIIIIVYYCIIIAVYYYLDIT